MPKRSDARALKNLIDQAYRIVSSKPVSPGGIESLEEILYSARMLAKELLSSPTSVPAATLGKLGGEKTAERGPEYFRQIAAMRKTRAGGKPRREEQ
ncbi:MAG: hypothetical protein ABSG13_26130 [Bryobacteraceae bacterium]|jgi:hypothetical protein